MSDTENDILPGAHIGDPSKYLASWEDDVPAMDLEKLDVKSFNDALRRSSQHQDFEKTTDYSLPKARHSVSILSEDDILQKINVSKILGDDDAESGDITFDMLIPTEKVGLLIGKGGKNIKALQEKSGARMNVIQHSNTCDGFEKTLRMVGPPDLVQHARYLVYELINRSPEQTPTKMTSGPNESYRPSTSASATIPTATNLKTIRYPVPKISVGLIIGRGGETIKKIRTETGAKVQFDPVNNNLEDLDEQVATVTGKPDQIRSACQMIQELVRTALKGLRQKNSKSYHEEPSKHYTYTDGRRKSTGAVQIIKKHISVPADKAGIFEAQVHILDEISSQSGAYCCIDRSDVGVGLTSEASETIFILKGQPKQVEVATDLIMKKVRSCQPQPQQYVKYSKPYQREPERGGIPSKHNEWGQGDPSAPWSMQNPKSSRSQESSSKTSFSHSQWLEYFQPERQQAQADAWEQKVKEEQDSTLPQKKATKYEPPAPPSTSNENMSAEKNPDEGPLLSKLQPITEQWSESTPDPLELSGIEIESNSKNVCENSNDERTETKEEEGATITSENTQEGPIESSSPNVYAPGSSFQFSPQGFPQFGPSTRVVTLYYDINSNSVVVLNQWNYA